jgi:hypothetical protein
VKETDNVGKQRRDNDYDKIRHLVNCRHAVNGRWFHEHFGEQIRMEFTTATYIPNDYASFERLLTSAVWASDLSFFDCPTKQHE